MNNSGSSSSRCEHNWQGRNRGTWSQRFPVAWMSAIPHSSAGRGHGDLCPACTAVMLAATQVWQHRRLAAAHAGRCAELSRLPSHNWQHAPEGQPTVGAQCVSGPLLLVM